MTNFSVLLSVYKKENPVYLEKSLKSIFNQTLTPNEVFLIKDGELTNELNAVISSFKSKFSYLKVYGYKKNMGVGYALDFGLKKCNNDIIFRCDSDDINFLNRFELQLEFMLKNNYAIVGSNIEEFYENPGDLKRLRKVPNRNSDIQKNKFIRNPFNHMAVVFKKSIIIKCGGYIDMPGYEDYYLWVRVLKNYCGFNFNRPLVYARVGNDMINRRRGYSFFKKEIAFQSIIYNQNYTNLLIFIRNFFLRAIPRFFPVKVLEFIYSFFLRR